MVKLAALPAKTIIDGFKGVIDFYVHYQSCDRSSAGAGTPCARSWPRSPGRRRAPTVEAQWAPFAYAATNWNSLDPYVQEAYKSTVQETNLTPRDLFTKSFITDYFREGQWYKPVTNPPPLPEEEILLPSCSVYLSAPLLNLVHATPTIIPFNLKNFDIGGNFDIVNHRFVCPIDGSYLIIITVLWYNCIPSSILDLRIHAAGNYVRSSRHIAMLATYQTHTYSSVVNLLSGNFIYAYAVSEAGVDTVDIWSDNSPYWTRLEIALLE